MEGLGFGGPGAEAEPGAVSGLPDGAWSCL